MIQRRRLVWDYETRIDVSEAMILVAMGGKYNQYDLCLDIYQSRLCGTV